MLGAVRLRAQNTRHDGDVSIHTAGEATMQNTRNDEQKLSNKNSTTAATSLLAVLSTLRYLT